MRASIGCSATIFAAAFFLGSIGSLFVPGASFQERMAIAGMFAATVVVAVVMLCARDSIRYSIRNRMNIRAVRRMLLARDDLVDDPLLHALPEPESTSIVQTREAVAHFFDVPAQKVRLTDTLRGDLRSDLFEQDLQFFAMRHVLNARHVTCRGWRFPTVDSDDVRGLAGEMQRAQNEVESKNTAPIDQACVPEEFVCPVCRKKSLR